MANHWPLIPLGEILTERNETPNLADLESGAIRIVSKIGFNEGQIELRNDGSTKTGMILIRPGDLVLSGINAIKGAIAVYDKNAAEPIAATIHYGAYIPRKDRVDTRFLWWLLRSETFRDILLEYLPGGIKSELKPKRFLPIPIPLPPLAEQQRIVARIEELARRVEEARGLRREAVEEAEALIATSASHLPLSDHCWTTVEAAVLKKKGSVRSGPFGSQLLHEEFVESGIAAIGTRDVQANRFALSGGWFVTPEKFDELRRYQVFPGDVLGTIVGASIGRFCVVPPEVPLAFTTKHIQALTLDSALAEPEFVSFVLNFHTRCRASLFSQVEGSAQPSLNAPKILATEIPLPSLVEQHRIVAHLDGLQAKVDELRRLQAETQKELDALMPSVLAKAFAGEL